MFNYYISARKDEFFKEVYANDYLLAWEIFRMMTKIFPTDSQIDLVDARTGEVIQCNDPNF